MKKMILGVSLVSALVLVTGCGDDKDKKVAIDDVTVKYAASGTYDMSQYMLASDSQINSYVSKTFTNDKGKKSYKDVADETTYPASRFDVNGSIIKEYDDTDDELDTTSTILSDRIKQIDAEDNEVSYIARYAEKGDYIIKIVSTDTDGFTLKTACKLNKQLTSKEINTKTYNDVIEVVCNAEGSQTTTVAGQEVSVTSESNVINLFAKGKGLISSITEDCYTRKDGDTITKEVCEKEIQEITNIH